MSYLAEKRGTGFDTQRHILGLVVSACASAFAGAGLLTIEALNYEGTPLAISVLFLFFPVLLAICGIASVVVGMPATLLLHRLRMESLWAYVAMGFLFGTLIAKFVFTSEYRDTLSFYAEFGGLPGIAWGLTWWMVARRRPNDD